MTQIKKLSNRIDTAYVDAVNRNTTTVAANTLGGWGDTSAGSALITDYLTTDNWDTTWGPGASNVLFPQGVSESDIIIVDDEPITIGELVRMMRKMAYLMKDVIETHDIAEELATGEEDG